MSYVIRRLENGDMQIVFEHYQISKALVDIFPHCKNCDTTGSYSARLEMFDGLLLQIKRSLREEIALDIETKNLGGCGRSHCGVDFREFNKIFAAIARGEVSK